MIGNSNLSIEAAHEVRQSCWQCRLRLFSSSCVSSLCLPQPPSCLCALLRIVLVRHASPSCRASASLTPQVGMKCVALAGRQPVYELAAADLVVRDLSQLSFVNLKKLFATEETVSRQVRQGRELLCGVVTHYCCLCLPCLGGWQMAADGCLCLLWSGCGQIAAAVCRFVNVHAAKWRWLKGTARAAHSSLPGPPAAPDPCAEHPPAMLPILLQSEELEEEELEEDSDGGSYVTTQVLDKW